MNLAIKSFSLKTALIFSQSLTILLTLRLEELGLTINHNLISILSFNTVIYSSIAIQFQEDQCKKIGGVKNHLLIQKMRFS